MTRFIKKGSLVRNPTAAIFDVFTRHERLVVTQGGRPVAVIEPVDTWFLVVLTEEQLAGLRERFGSQLSPPALVERAILEVTGRSDE